MKTILLWDLRFPDRSPTRLSVDETLASAAVRSGVAAAADPAQAGALNTGPALDPGMLTEVVLQHGVNGTAMARVFLPYSVVLAGAAAGVLASIGTPIAGTPTPTPTSTPTLSLSSAVTQVEGNSGTAALVWTLTLARNGSTAAFPYSWAVAGSGASPADVNDFGGTFPSGSGTFAVGETSKSITVLVAGDTAVEPDETFTLTVTSAGLSTVTSTGTISNDDTSFRITTLSGGRSAELGMPTAYWPAIYSQTQDPNMHPSLGTFTVNAVKSGNWSDPTVWDTGAVPTGGALVSIASTYEVLYDTSTPIAPYASPAALLTAYRAACDTLATAPADSTALSTVVAIEALVIKAVHVGSTATFRVSTSVSTFLLSDNIVVHGSYIAGEDGTPVTHLNVIIGTSDPGATTKTGIMTMGRTRMVGAPKTPFTKFSIDPTKDATQITLDQVPANWQIGDEIVITSTTFAGNTASDVSYTGPSTFWGPSLGTQAQMNSSSFKTSNDEVRVISGIAGPVVSFATPLTYNHPTRSGALHDGTATRIESRCVNFTRSLRYEGAFWREKGVSGTGRHRGHTMHMHMDDIVRKYAEFKNLGRTRTDPSLTSVSNTTASGLKASSTGAYLADPNNVIGRYPVHDHWTGPYFYRRAVISEGLAIHADLAGDPTPGWGYTQHHSRASLKNCATFNTRGAGFACELGSEIGQWDGCISIFNRGDGYSVPGFGDRYEQIANHNGHAGVAFDMQSRAIILVNCIGVSSRYSFIWHQQKNLPMSGRSPDAAALRFSDPITQGQSDTLSYAPYGVDLQAVYGHQEPQIPDFVNNEAHDCDIGYYVSSRDVHDGGDVMPMVSNGYKALSDQPYVIFNYSFNYSFANFYFVGKGKGISFAALSFGTKSYTFNFVNGRVEGYSYVINDLGGYNYAGFVVDISYDTTGFANPNAFSISSGNTLASHPANGIMGPWTLVSQDSASTATVRVRDYAPLTSADMPQPYPIAPFSSTTEPAPGTPKPYIVLDAGTGGTITPAGTGELSVSGVLVDSWGIRYWPSLQRFQSGAIDPARPVRKNAIANGAELVRRNGCYTADGGTTWKTRLWFNDADRGTHARVLIPVDVNLSGFAADYLTKHQVADGNATKPSFPMVLEDTTYDNTPSIQTKVYLWDYTNLTASFSAAQDVAPSSTATSNTLTVTRLSAGQTVPVSIAGGTYSQNGGAYTNAATTAKLGDTFTLQNANSATLGTATTATLTINSTAYLFVSTVQNYPATGTMVRDYFDDQTADQNLDARTGWELLSGTAGSATVTSAKKVSAAGLAAQTSVYRYATDLGSLQQYVEFNVETSAFLTYRHMLSMSDALNPDYSSGARIGGGDRGLSL